MKVYMAKLDKATLKSIPSCERSLFLSLAHFANEIKALHKLIAWSADFTSGGNAQVNGQVSLTLMLLKLLAGKLWEGHNLLGARYYGTGVSRHYDSSLTEEGRAALSEIKRYFGRHNDLDPVRNKYAFHYSPDEVDAALPGVPEELEMYMQSQGSANNLYYFAEVLANRALFQSIGAEDNEIGLPRLINEDLRVAHWFSTVCDALMAEFVSRHFSGIWKGQAEEVVFSDLRRFSSVRIPWFTDTSDLPAEGPP